MHKLTKGLKKKKKGKKSKHKEDDLFKPEELEAYRREKQAHSTTPTSDDQGKSEGKESEEWKKFTAEIDSVLKKTQDDLDRIKSTSFFQRIPTPSTVEKKENTAPPAPEAPPAPAEETAKKDLGVVEVSESETEEEDDIFDTSYIDAIATGEVKLAYIPESPTEQKGGDDPFDTSIAERAILGPAVEKKGKKLVPIGAAVEVLTGRVQAPTCVPVKRPTPKRTAFQQKDLLLGSFDEGIKETVNSIDKDFSENKPTLLDTDDAPPDLATSPIDLSKNLLPTTFKGEDSEAQQTNDFVKEFSSINKQERSDPYEDDEDKEFELLAAESLSKSIVTTCLSKQELAVSSVSNEEQWNAFSESDFQQNLENSEEGLKDDPFDTAFAENILPGKVELKLIEKEILLSEEETIVTQKGRRVSESFLQVIQPKHRDLLGGSNTDLTKLGDEPLKPQEKHDENYIEYCDPFDTSVVIDRKPCQTELKYLEEELLNDIKNELTKVIEDDNFDPRAEEAKERKSSLKSVTFTLPLPSVDENILSVEEQESKRVGKPLTPYYIRENSIPEEVVDGTEEGCDPFDTSFVKDVRPGKVELKIIENELFGVKSDKNVDNQAARVTTDSVKPLHRNGVPNAFDLLTTNEEVTAKVLTPAIEQPSSDFSSYSDPFDTSIASNLGPGQVELKLLEKELINSETIPNNALHTEVTSSHILNTNSAAIPVTQSNKIPDLLEAPSQPTSIKPLSPVQIDEINEAEFLDEVDPFDTSIADNINLGKTELKLLESELL